MSTKDNKDNKNNKMNEESFMLVSLEENKAKKLAEVISNDTARKILDLLSKKDATETDISKELKVPISTVHYNLKQLVTANLVKVDEFHYSKKGKEINHYSLANKLIIITQKESETGKLKDALKKFWPLVILSVVATFVVGLLSNVFQSQPMYAMSKGVNLEMQTPEPPTTTTVSFLTQPFWQNIALWFFIGALFVLLLYFIFEMIRKRK